MSQPPYYSSTKPLGGCDHKFVDSNKCLKCGWSPTQVELEVRSKVALMSDVEVSAALEGAKRADSQLTAQSSKPLRSLVYMMHPLGGASNRERNRKLACLWQAAIQEAHPEWIVVAPWIGLSGAWSEDKRDLGMEVDLATIDACAAGVIAGPLDGPVTVRGVPPLDYHYVGVSPGMADELHYLRKEHPMKLVHDARTLFKIELPADWTPPRVVRAASEFMPRFEADEVVFAENKPGGVCRVRSVEEMAPGAYRYLVERTETFFAHEQSLAKMPWPGYLSGRPRQI